MSLVPASSTEGSCRNFLIELVHSYCHLGEPITLATFAQVFYAKSRSRLIRRYLYRQ